MLQESTPCFILSLLSRHAYYKYCLLHYFRLATWRPNMGRHDIRLNNIQESDTQQKSAKNATPSKWASKTRHLIQLDVILLSAVLPNVVVLYITSLQI
jgi:hypothetical protein